MSRKIRVRNGFSDREGVHPIPKMIQTTSFLKETRICLFNSFKQIMEDQIRLFCLSKKAIAKRIVEDAFNEIYSNEYEWSYDVVLNEILSVFKEGQYDEILTIIEFCCNLVFKSRSQYKEAFSFDITLRGYDDVRESMNKAFEKEFVGYRFIDNYITRIVDQSEIDEIAHSFNGPYDSVNDSIRKSISMLSENGDKDYKNSIKEAVMALEQLCNILLHETGLVLSNSFERICALISTSDYLKESIKKLYKFASDENGIRHGNNKESYEIRFDDAKYILVICSSTINYLLSLKEEIDLAIKEKEGE